MRSLNGQWSLARDPENLGLRERWYEAETLPGARETPVPESSSRPSPVTTGLSGMRGTSVPLPCPTPGAATS